MEQCISCYCSFFVLGVLLETADATVALPGLCFIKRCRALTGNPGMAHKIVTIHYRKLGDVGRAALGRSLQEALARAMNHRLEGVRLRDDWNLRTETLEDQDRRFLNNYRPTAANLFGTFLVYEQDAHQALLSNMGHVADVEVAQEPPDAGEQFLKGILYWLIVNDHLFAIQSASLRIPSFEQHLEWLLRLSNTLPPDEEIELIAEFDRGAVGGDLDVRRVAVHGRIVSPVRADELAANVQLVEQERIRKVAAQRGLPISRAKALAILRALFPNGDTADRLYNEIPADGELDYNFELMLKTRDLEARRRFNRELQRDLRDAEDGQVRAVGPDGTMSGDDIRLHMTMPVQLVGNLLSIEDAREQLITVYDRFLADGKIEE